jgi:hypothetical protein
MSVVLKLLTLMKLTANQPIVDPSTGYPTSAFQRLQNDRATNETTIVNAIATQVNDITAALDQAGIATTEAQAASATAQTAATGVATVTGQQALVWSFITNGVLTAHIDPNDTTKAVVSIGGHTRYYADGSMVAVSAGTISGQAPSTTGYVYYSDPSRAGGNVTFHITSDTAVAAQLGATHTIGAITTPALAAPATTGITVRAPGIPA